LNHGPYRGADYIVRVVRPTLDDVRRPVSWTCHPQIAWQEPRLDENERAYLVAIEVHACAPVTLDSCAHDFEARSAVQFPERVPRQSWRDLGVLEECS